MVLVATARYPHTWVRPWTRGFQSLQLCWTSWRPLGRGTYTLDHHQTQQWVRNRITENNWGCCISGRAKQPTINYNVKTKHRNLPGEVARLQLWEVGKPGIQPHHAGPHPVLCYFFSAATIWLTLCLAKCRHWKKWRESTKQPQKTIWGLTEISDGERRFTLEGKL